MEIVISEVYVSQAIAVHPLKELEAKLWQVNRTLRIYACCGYIEGTAKMVLIRYASLKRRQRQPHLCIDHDTAVSILIVLLG